MGVKKELGAFWEAVGDVCSRGNSIYGYGVS